MKRAIGVLVGLAIAAAALAQAPFTIVRPADGSKVREKVRIQIPKNSVPEGGYVGIFVGGKFIEALVPRGNEKFYEYILDTKGRGIPDGNLKVEAVLYMDSDAAAPKILDRSSVTVSVQNSASIKVPNSGFLLRYNFQPMTQYIYRHVSRSSVAIISEAEAKMGGRAAELPLDYETIRISYEVDQKFSNGDGLVRIQALPDKGKDYAYFNAVLDGEDAASSRLYMENELGALYMRLTATGHEQFASMPIYYPMEGSPGSNADQLYIIRALPTLPTKRVKPGDTWASRFQMGKLPGEKGGLFEARSVIQQMPARGEFLGVEWEMGRPCAKIRNIITATSKTLEGTKLAAAGSTFTDEKVTLDETTWFALDKRMVMKTVINLVIDRKVPAGGSGAQGGPRSTGGPTGSGSLGLGGLGGGDDEIKATGQRKNLPGATGGQGVGPVGAGGGQGGRGGAGQGRGAGAAGNQWVRIRSQIVMVIER